MRITNITARSIPDTRGRPTIETTLSTQQGSTLCATASVPSGKSTGKSEAFEMDAALAISNINEEVSVTLAERDFNSPDELDSFLIELDGTENKSRLGANAILSVSVAAMRLFALQDGELLWRAIAKRAGTTPSAPRLFVNVMNGGIHAGFKLPFQEYILVVEGKTSSALLIAQKAFTKLGELLTTEGRLASLTMGDEGGYAPTFDTLEQPFEILEKLVKESPSTSIAIDAAASQLFHEGAYNILGKEYSVDDLAKTYANLVKSFDVRSIEDPFDENAIDDFVRLTSAVDERLLIVGDDLTCSNPKLISDAVINKAVNAIIIKPNQIGTVMEAIESVKIAQSAGLRVIASHRSGETDDTFIADFAYGIGAYGIKAGGLGQKERVEKYDRLLAIEREAEMI
ncbi:MAG: phosphopyruvate hydratase [bacterium]|nr:phosphopyruvate hydratase [bacterium]